MPLTPTEVVQRQLDAYNERDIEAFLLVFAEDAQAGELSASPTLIGKAQLRQRYGELFANSPALHSVILNRTAFGHVVIDYERITGRNGSAEPFEIIAIYEVQDGLIRRVHFVRAQ